ncbi:type IV toxin-antitoxin system AbiEi family antitoxin domain-containing protein [Gordonia sp. PP30]|uniref:type IV toxin-antitoxin system AbiEi family antitoxin domain-containing protein n=1 Tax=Gordonia sp. PP30 TaxID=2935861 RepID=UPI001FFE922B|nr:type IV toxin-antitoxin system AbiEi family antitoxin domain-containing protein [Gordonia sp. PP30]UQE74530.1 type IV toxin-antitoxin system AbiEi family antitoxin domain-containing protein [Gordonia sp. PP30]
MWTYDDHGLIYRKTVLESGVTPREFDAAVRAGVLVRVARGVYLDALALRGLPGYRQRQAIYRAKCLAAAAAGPGDRVLSHQSAAALHGLELLSPDRRCVHAITGHSSHGYVRNRRFLIHACPVDDADIVVIEGVRVTGLARTAADIARSAGFPRALAALDSALHAGVTREELDELVKPSRRGAAGARYALRHADGLAANPGESWSRALMITAGFPVPKLQVRYILGSGDAAVVDCDWDGKVVGEFDGVVKYSGEFSGPGEAPAEVVVAEKIREDGLRDLGLDVVRWVYRDLRDGSMLERVRQRLRAAGLVVPDARPLPPSDL